MFGLLAPLLIGGIGAPTAAVGSAALGGSLFGSLASSALSMIGQRAQARADRSQAVGDVSQQFVRLRDAAERAGFNPLTALRANPSGGMVNPTPALASNSFVANALNDGLQTMFNAPQRAADAERDALERALMRQELANAQMQGKAYAKAMSFGYEIPQANNYSGVDRANASGALSPLGSDRGANGVTVAGIRVHESDAWSPAQAVEDRYGDLAQAAYGLIVAGADGITTFRANNPDKAKPQASFKVGRYPSLGRVSVSKLDTPSWQLPGVSIPDTVDEAKRLGGRLYRPRSWPLAVSPTFSFFQ